MMYARALTYLDDILENGTVIRIRNAWCLLSCNSNQGQALFLEDVVRLDYACNLLVGRFQIGADNREGQILEEVAKLVFATIEFVVTKSHGIKFQVVESFGDLFSSVEGVEKCALEFVANVQPKAVVVLGPLLLDNSLDTRVASVAATLGPCAICSRRAELVKMGVDIIDVEEGYGHVSNSVLEILRMGLTDVVVALSIKSTLCHARRVQRFFRLTDGSQSGQRKGQG